MNICVYAYKKCSRYIIIIIQQKKDAHIRKEAFESIYFMYRILILICLWIELGIVSFYCIQFKISYGLTRKYRYILQDNSTRCLWCRAFDEWIWKFGRIATMTPRWTFCIEQILIAQSYFCYIIALSQHREINLRDNTFCCAFASTQQVLI